MVDCILLIPKGTDEKLLDSIVEKLKIKRNGYNLSSRFRNDVYYEIHSNVAIDFDTRLLRKKKPLINILSFHNKIIEVW